MSPRGGSWTPEKEALLFRGVLQVLDTKFTQAQYQELSDFMNNEFSSGAISQRITKVLKKAGGGANDNTPLKAPATKAGGTPSSKSKSSAASGSNQAVYGSSSPAREANADVASGGENKRKRATAASFFDDYSPPPATKKVQSAMKKAEEQKKKKKKKKKKKAKARADVFDGARRMAAGFLDKFSPDV